MSEGWPGCHGVRISGPFDVGTNAGTPTATATVRIADLPPPDGPTLWRVHGEVTAVDGERREVDRWLCRHGDGHLIVHASKGPAVGVDPSRGEVTIEPGDHALSLQLLTTFAVPMILNSNDVLVLHASACERNGEALVMAGETGAGKSSALVRLVDAGWRAVSEDVCVVDVTGGQPAVWPGPPWVRRVHGDPGPRGATARFETPDKTAWDISPWQTRRPVPVSRLVFLERPGGETAQWETLRPPEAVGALAGHAVWLMDPADGPGRLFGLAVELAGRVASARLRVPHSAASLERLPTVLAEGP